MVMAGVMLVELRLLVARLLSVVVRRFMPSLQQELLPTILGLHFLLNMFVLLVVVLDQLLIMVVVEEQVVI